MKNIFSLLALIFVVKVSLAQTSLIIPGDAWKYLDNGSNQGIAWRASSFNDASWASGASELGYGDSDEATVVGYGPSSTSKYITTYFRKTINIVNASQYLNYTLKVKRDDGVVIYVNGNEVYRNNLSGTVNFNTLATSASDDGGSWLTTALNSTVFTTGNNTIAAEIHQTNATSSDITFNLELLGNTTVPLSIKDIRWGSQNDPLNGLTITWANSGLADSIKWGYTNGLEQGKFAGIRRNANAVNNYFFKYTFPSAQANSTIYYKLYDSNVNAWGGELTYNTAPPINTSNFCFLGIGDSRSGLSVWNQISNLAHSKNTDFTIYNGDIVNDGNSNTDWDNWFSNGNNYIKNNLIYHSMGNHDANSSTKYSNTFELPQVNSSNLYYSFNYGNALYICLNSENPTSTTQYNWLVSTLQANQSATWKIVFFHRPFYTIGSHAGEMNSYFNTWWQAFDDYGVDLICNGHDHMYERTKPINRNISTTGPVTNYGSNPGEGRCQIVCGGAGAPLYGGTPTNMIQKYQSKYNFVEFCVNGNSLHGDVFDETNSIIDTFTLVKSITTDIKNLKQEFNPIEIYPNPTKNNFSIKNQSSRIGIGTLRILDLNGVVVREEKINKTEINFEYQMDNINIAPGAYFVELSIKEQKDVIMLMIN